MNENILVLRTCAADLSSREGKFTWPSSGPVEALDWNPEPVCGGGLHGLAWGEGDGTLLGWSDDAKWLVVSVPKIDVINLGGRVKFPRGEVVFCGERAAACAYLAERGGAGRAVVGHTAIAGDRGKATAGYRGAATAGHYGTAMVGDRGTATAGYYGMAIAGNRGAAIAGDRGKATAGYRGAATAGHYGTAIAGDCGTATAGDSGTATAGNEGTAIAGDHGPAIAGDYGTATAGDCGTAIAGDCGTATAGDSGIIIISYYDDRDRRLVGYVGEDGIEPNVPYRVESGKFVRA